MQFGAGVAGEMITQLFDQYDPAKLPRSVKQTMVFALDCALVPISLFLAFALRLGTLSPFLYPNASWELVVYVSVAGAAVIYFTQLSKLKLHAFDVHSIMRVAICACGLTVVAVLVSTVLGLWAPRSVPLIFGAVFFFAAVATRMTILSVLTSLRSFAGTQIPVAIYGAGSAGIQLATALQQSTEVRPVVFVDDNIALQGLIVAGISVRSPDRLASMAKSGQIRRILLAMPSITRARRNALVAQLGELECEVQIIPSFVDILSGQGEFTELQPVAPDELLGRDKVDLDTPEIAQSYTDHVVMVTGAGGSIGSELCKQLIQCKPKKIVLFEHSEIALYDIDRVLKPRAEAMGIEVVSCLGSVVDARRVKRVISEQSVEIILHAAAYKHVTIVEENELVGARNNILGTRIVANAAREANIARFILISTDKAVRPTSMMGATKHLAELVVQNMQTHAKDTKFAMVRFGNVLGSSGSVLPLFKQQIAAGGPVTVTHPDVTRYFMTIQEASRLVLLAGAYAKGGDLFVLDMGKPIRILDVARNMIVLSGRRVADENSQESGIAIEFIGMRPGEKLYEELFIDPSNLTDTPHPKIMRAKEAGQTEANVCEMLQKVTGAIKAGDRDAFHEVIETYVDGYQRTE